MTRKSRGHVPGVPVHITTRGVGGRAIFLTDLARQLFLQDLLAIQKELPFIIYAYCLMTNHLHLLVEAIEAELSDVMEWLLGQHAKRVNRALERRGYVFEKRFDDTICVSDAHFRNAVAYISNNPVRAKMVPHADAWAWSSHRELVGAAENIFIRRDLVLDRVGGVESYQRLLSRQPREDVVRLTTALLGQKLKADAFLELAGQSPRECLEALAGAAATATGLSVADIVGDSRMRREATARNLFIAKARELGLPGNEIGRFLGKSSAAVARAVKRVKEEPGPSFTL